ncbi:MAG: heavy metal transporter [Bacteroidota bacterium]
MFLVSSAVIIMFLVLWEEFLFPVKVKPSGDGVVFRNHRTKLKKQLLIWCLIPAIFAFVYAEYNVNLVRFIIWSAICVLGPVAGKLISGINNYNDFLRLTNDEIEYRNNKEVGKFQLKDLQRITLVRDERKVLHKLNLLLADNSEVIIDLDEMELQDFLMSIDKFMSARYQSLVKGATSN